MQCLNRRYLKIKETDDLVWNTVVSILGRSHRFKEEMNRQVFPDGSAPNSADEVSQLKKAKKKAKKSMVAKGLSKKEAGKLVKQAVNNIANKPMKRSAGRGR